MPFSISPGSFAVDAGLLPQLLGDVHGAGVVEVQLQRDDVGPVRLRRRLLRVGHHLDARHLGGDAFQRVDRDGHIVERRVGPRGGNQRQGRGALVGEVLLELALHAQRLRTLDLEPTAGEVIRLVQREVHRGHEEKQPRREHRPAISAQAAAQAHHELLDSELPAFCPALPCVSLYQRGVGCRGLSNALTVL